jgi:hypothetical protein
MRHLPEYLAWVRGFDVQNADVIECGVVDFARSPNGGLVITPDSSVSKYRFRAITPPKSRIRARCNSRS